LEQSFKFAKIWTNNTVYYGQKTNTPPENSENSSFLERSKGRIKTIPEREILFENYGGLKKM